MGDSLPSDSENCTETLDRRSFRRSFFSKCHDCLPDQTIVLSDGSAPDAESDEDSYLDALEKDALPDADADADLPDEEELPWKPSLDFNKECCSGKCFSKFKLWERELEELWGHLHSSGCSDDRTKFIWNLLKVCQQQKQTYF